MNVSIPYGTIKRYRQYSGGFRLYPVSIPYGTIKRWRNANGAKIERVSIPYGTIKRPAPDSPS